MRNRFDLSDQCDRKVSPDIVAYPALPSDRMPSTRTPVTQPPNVSPTGPLVDVIESEVSDVNP